MKKARDDLSQQTYTARQIAAVGAKINPDTPNRTALDALSLSDFTVEMLLNLHEPSRSFDLKALQQIKNDALYAHYIERQERDVAALAKDEGVIVPADLDYSEIGGLSNELQQKLKMARPYSLAHAAKVDGMTPAALLVISAHLKLDVSRETFERLKLYEQLIIKWNKTINLVSKSTLDQIWDRHIVDSAQLLSIHIDNTENWLDIGSGGGLPGIVIAAILVETSPNTHLTLVESDQRKCAFLRTASRELGLKTTVKAERIEQAKEANADVLTARALKPLDELFLFSERHLKPTGVALFAKGKSAKDEITFARQNWNFDVVAHPSITDNEASILEVRNITRVSV